MVCTVEFAVMLAGVVLVCLRWWARWWGGGFDYLGGFGLGGLCLVFRLFGLYLFCCCLSCGLCLLFGLCLWFGCFLGFGHG